MTHIFTTHWRNEPGDPARCRAAVHDEIGVGFHQCNRKPTVFRCVDGKEGEFGFCKQHDPVAVESKRKARQDKWNAEWKAKQAAWDRDAKNKAALLACREAIEQIAKGHNDPRTLATEVLCLFPE